MPDQHIGQGVFMGGGPPNALIGNQF